MFMVLNLLKQLNTYEQFLRIIHASKILNSFTYISESIDIADGFTMLTDGCRKNGRVIFIQIVLYLPHSTPHFLRVTWSDDVTHQ